MLGNRVVAPEATAPCNALLRSVCSYCLRILSLGKEKQMTWRMRPTVLHPQLHAVTGHFGWPWRIKGRKRSKQGTRCFSSHALLQRPTTQRRTHSLSLHRSKRIIVNCLAITYSAKVNTKTNFVSFLGNTQIVACRIDSVHSLIIRCHFSPRHPCAVSSIRS